ncbi:MAG: DUF3108 domain-containing protein [Pseudomonadota bacterium]
MLILLLAMAGTNALHATEAPPAFRAEYVVKKGPMLLGRSVRQLEHGADGQLVFQSSSDTTGLANLLLNEHIRETSHLRLNGAHVLPQAYEYRRDGKRTRRVSQQYDWQQDSVTSTLDERVYHFEIPAVTYDPSGYQVSLMIDLAGGARDMDYSIASSKGLRTWDIRHVGDETVKTPLGTLDTVVIQRKTDQVTTMWCAPKLHYLPVKIVHEEDGVAFTATLESLSGPLAKASGY